MKGISIEVMIYIQHEAKTSIKFSDRIKGYQGLAYLEDIFNEKIRYSKDVDHAHPKILVLSRVVPSRRYVDTNNPSSVCN